MKDRYGATHYVMVEPDLDHETFHQGDKILIVKQTGSGCTAIHHRVAELQEID